MNSDSWVAQSTIAKHIVNINKQTIMVIFTIQFGNGDKSQFQPSILMNIK